MGPLAQLSRTQIVVCIYVGRPVSKHQFFHLQMRWIRGSEEALHKCVWGKQVRAQYGQRSSVTLLEGARQPASVRPGLGVESVVKDRPQPTRCSIHHTLAG